MKLEDLPDFAKPYKKKGFDVRKSGDAYRLLRITSKRVEGKKYPVLVQEYIGTILKDGTLRKAQEKGPSFGPYQEFGLSDFLMNQHKRLLQRSLYGYKGEQFLPLLKLAVLFYVFGSISPIALTHSRLTVKDADALAAIAATQRPRIERLSKKIQDAQEELFGEEKTDFELLMRLCVVDALSQKTPPYPPEALEILKRRGLTP